MQAPHYMLLLSSKLEIGTNGCLGSNAAIVYPADSQTLLSHVLHFGNVVEHLWQALLSGSTPRKRRDVFGV
jgi:hypothetical protein